MSGKNVAKQNLGFTLIELLVVIAIIALLSTVVIASVKSARDKAKYNLTLQKIQELKKVINVAQQESGATLGKITNNFWTAGGCSIGAPTWTYILDFNSIPKDHTCYTAYQKSIDNLVIGTKGLYSSSTAVYLSTDGWGHPFLLDENQGEGGLESKCGNYDGLRSVGADGITYTADDLNTTLPLSDSCP